MNTTTLFSIGIATALMLAVVISLPASAQPTYGSGFSLLPSASDPPTVLQVKKGFHGGFYGGWYGGKGPWNYGGGFGPSWGYGDSGDGYGYYQEGARTCVWNGYNYRCYKTYPEVY